eukprot:546870-Rhodomonas_salina.1
MCIRDSARAAQAAQRPGGQNALEATGSASVVVSWYGGPDSERMTVLCVLTLMKKDSSFASPVAAGSHSLSGGCVHSRTVQPQAGALTHSLTFTRVVVFSELSRRHRMFVSCPATAGCGPVDPRLTVEKAAASRDPANGRLIAYPMHRPASRFGGKCHTECHPNLEYLLRLSSVPNLSPRYPGTALQKSLQIPAAGSAAMGDLENVFGVYCNGEPTMDGKSFAKLAKDTKLLDSRLTATDVDLVFAKVKDKTARRITFSQFMEALVIFAGKKGVDSETVQNKVAASKGPVLSGTVAEANKFHDDKSLYTGVHAKGGPSTIDTDKIHDISQIMDRSDADVRGVSVNYQSGAARTSSGNVARVASPRASFAVGVTSSGRSPETGSMRQSMVMDPDPPEPVPSKSPQQHSPPAHGAFSDAMGDLQNVFGVYCNGEPTMDGKSLAKLAKDTKLLDSRLTATDVDLVFAKVKDKAARRITYSQFLEALAIFAQKKGVDSAAVQAKVAASKGPVLSGTVAEAN